MFVVTVTTVHREGRQIVAGTAVVDFGHSRIASRRISGDRVSPRMPQLASKPRYTVAVRHSYALKV